MNYNRAISQIDNDVFIKINVIPNSSQSIFPAGYNKWRNSIVVKVKAKPQENKANSEIISIISTFFNISQKNVHIISGQKNKEKKVLLKDSLKKDILKKIEDIDNGL